LLSNIYKAVSTLKSLRDLGVQVAIDDSGTDFPSLNYLRQLPIAMVPCLGLLVVAEGMKKSNKNHLSASAAIFYRGFLYSRPVPLGHLALGLEY